MWIEITLDAPVHLYGMIAQKPADPITSYITGYRVQYKEIDSDLFHYITNKVSWARRVRKCLIPPMCTVPDH